MPIDIDLAVRSARNAREAMRTNDPELKPTMHLAAARELAQAWDDINLWLSKGGVMPRAWGKAQSSDPAAPRPVEGLDAFIKERTGGWVVIVGGTAHGGASNQVDAQETLDRLLVQKSYWPYCWQLHADTGVTVPIDLHLGAYTWWLAERATRDPFEGYTRLTPVKAGDVHSEQRRISAENEALGWQRYRIERGEVASVERAQTPHRVMPRVQASRHDRAGKCQFPGKTKPLCGRKYSERVPDPDTGAMTLACWQHARDAKRKAAEQKAAAR